MSDLNDDVELSRNVSSLQRPTKYLHSESSQKAKMPAKALEVHIMMRLGDITQEHHLVKELDRQLGLPFFAGPPKEFVPAAWLSALLERMPLMVRQDRGESIACVGNIRLYRLARLVLSGDDMIPVHRHMGSLTVRRRERLLEGLLAETFLMPAIFGRRVEEVHALDAGWVRTRLLGQMKHTEVDIASLYRSETVRSKRERPRG